MTKRIRLSYSYKFVEYICQCFNYITPKLTEYGIVSKLNIKNKIVYILAKYLIDSNLTSVNEMVLKKMVTNI